MGISDRLDELERRIATLESSWVKAGRPPTRRTECMEWLTKKLDSGKKRVSWILETGQQEKGYSSTLIRRSASALGVKRDGHYWVLDER